MRGISILRWVAVLLGVTLFFQGYAYADIFGFGEGVIYAGDMAITYTADKTLIIQDDTVSEIDGSDKSNLLDLHPIYTDIAKEVGKIKLSKDRLKLI